VIAPEGRSRGSQFTIPPNMALGRPVVWIDVVGLTPRLLVHAPTLSAMANAGSTRALSGVVPAVTCSAQATALTGLPPSSHGIVGNGWFHRETGEVRFWLQSHGLVGGETVEQAARRLAAERGRPFTAARLFGWFAQGAPVDFMVTPKPHYGCDGSKAFGVHGRPEELAPSLERELGPFPFPSFWGPRAGLPSTEWIARAAASVLRAKRPDFTLVYLPHLDYDLQRLGPEHDGVAARVAEVDRCAAVVIEAAHAIAAEVTVFSEYGIGAVSRFEEPNRVLRKAGLLAVRDGPFGEMLDPFESRAFAVCDHQVAHVHVQDPRAAATARDLLGALPGVARVLAGEERAEVGLDHPRAGDLVLLSKPDAWFSYPYWLDDRRAPDFARTVDIHRKPGYDPCELFVDPSIAMPALRVARRLLAKQLGFRYRMDVVPLDASLVRGSHGVPPADPADRPILVSEDSRAAASVASIADLKAHALGRLGLA
jgi:predicted AlkP superfamily pyrophosphatase or phosphodiesterase